MNIKDYAARLGYTPESKPSFDIEKGKQGYEKYLADQKTLAEQKKAEAEASKPRKWWQKVLDAYLQGQGMVSSSDNPYANTFVTQFNQTVDYYKNDTSYMKPSEDWSDEDRWRFGEKYATNREEAAEFAKEVNARITKEKRDAKKLNIAEWSKQNVGTQILGSVASLGANALGSAGYIDMLAQKIGRDDIVLPENLYAHEVGNTIQSSISQHYNEKGGTVNLGVLGERGWGDLYGIGMSVAQSKLAAVTGGTAGTLVQYFGTAAAQGMTDALERGATSDQAIAYGTISGAAEALTEMISVRSFLKIAKAKGVEKVFKSVLKQAGEEAREEFTTAVITEVADQWIMKGKSQFALTVNDLVAQGMSVEEAEKVALKQTLGNIAYDTISGAISGGISGGGAVAYNRVNQRFLQKDANAKAKETLTPVKDTLITEGKKYDSTVKTASKLEQKVAEGKELSGYELRMLASNVAAEKKAADVDTVRKAIVKKLESEGLDSKKAKTLGEIVLKKALGTEEVSVLENGMLKRNEIASRVYNSISAETMATGVAESDWADNTPLESLRAENKPNNGAEKPTLTEKEIASLSIPSRYAKPKYEINTESLKGKIDIRALAEENKIKFKKTSPKSKIHTDEIRSSLTREDIVELAAIERLANTLGIDFYIYESKENERGERYAVDKDGKIFSDNGFYDPKDNSIHLDLRAGENGEGVTLYTASHELVHFVKANAKEHYAALEKLVTDHLIKAGLSLEKLDKIQRDKAIANGQTLTEAEIREEVIAEACQSFLASKSAVAEIQALKTKNHGLWSALKKFFDSFFAKINKIYKEVPPDAPEGRVIADMHKAAKRIRQAFLEGVAEASNNAAKQGQADTNASKKATETEIRTEIGNRLKHNLRGVAAHKTKLETNYTNSASIPLETTMERYNKIIDIWKRVGGEIDSKFLAEWDSKLGKDRAFTVFKAQSGYKYNVELSSMCKKGVPLFEAIDHIVKEEIMKELKTDVIGKAEKEILYDLLKAHNFEIPCAICYVEQARQREGAIIDSFLNGKVEKNSSGKVTTYKLGWNDTLKTVEKEMKKLGVSYTFPAVSRSIDSENYEAADISMDEKTQKAFYEALLKLTNAEIERYNEETKEQKLKRKLKDTISTASPSAVNSALKGTLPANLKLFKVLFNNPSARFTIENDLLYSSMTTYNLAQSHNELYSLFNSQGGVSGYKTKQGTVVYWGDILGKTWAASKVRDEGGIRNQSNSDFQMYTLLDQAQMYIDFTAKGYYLQAYTKVLSELKLFGLSRGKINASLIPKVQVYYNADGTVDITKTRENAGLDDKGNLLFDDIEGINHKEAFMLIADSEYSKSIGGICIGYSDNHILKLLDDNRIQQIIGFHDKTDDPDKRYFGARYAKNYNGLNEAIDKDGGTVHIGFNPFVKKAEKAFKYDSKTETFSGTTTFNGKEYKADDIPKLAADMYLDMCREKGYTPAYVDFADRPNYYKLLADFSLYDSEGHYAPHRKVAFNMPDVIPYLDENGNKRYMSAERYIKVELEKELRVRDSISEALADKTANGLIPQFVKKVNELHSGENKIRHKSRGGVDVETLDNEYNAAYNSEDEEGTDFAKWARVWAYSDKTMIGERRFFFRGNSWTLLEKTDDGFVEVGSYTNVERKAFIEEIESANETIRNSIKTAREGLREDFGTYASLTGSDLRYNGNVERQRASNDRSGGIYKSKSGSNGATNYTSRVSSSGNLRPAPPPYTYPAVANFKDVNGSYRKVIKNNGQFMVEGTKKRNYLYDTIQEAIEAENAYLESKKVKHSARKHITPEMDASYLDAVNRGDMETAQRMVDEAAREAGYTIKGFHATNAEFTEFDISKTSDVNYHGRGIYFTNSQRDVESNYENYEAPDPWQKIEGEAYELLYDKYGYSYEDTLTNDFEIIDKLNECYDEVIDKFKKTLRRVTAYLKFDNPLVIGKHETIQDYDITKYDGIIDKYVHETIGQAGMDENTIHYIVWNPKNIKSAEAVTYDDNGNVIPLSERFDSASNDIRHKPRATVSAPYTSPTAQSIVTNIRQAYEPTRKDKLVSGAIATQIAVTNAQAGIESVAKKYGFKNIESLVQSARTASKQAEEMIGGNQYRIGSASKDYQGEGLQKIIAPIKDKGDEVYAAFLDYLFHQHNADRMSLERRSIEWNEEKKAELTKQTQRFASLQKEQTDLNKEREQYARKRNDAAKTERDRIDRRLAQIKRELAVVSKLMRKLQQEISAFTVLKNKPVLARPKEEIEAKKAEINARIAELSNEKKSLGLSKANAERVKAISVEIADLTKQSLEIDAPISEEESRKIIEEYEANYDNFLETAEKVWKYNANLNQYRVDTGLISQEQYDYLQKLYSHYVPTYRDGSNSGIAAVRGKNNLAVNQSIKSATGSTRDLLDPIVIMARQTMETIRAGRINKIADALYEGAIANGDKTYITEASRKRLTREELADLDPTELRPKSNQVTFFKDGEKITLNVSSEIFAGFNAFSPDLDIKNPLMLTLNKGNEIFKKLVTSWNPVFLLRNAVRDLQDAGINTKYFGKFGITLPVAHKEILTNGELWKLYRAMGGSNVDVFDFDKGFKKDATERGFDTRWWKTMENANNYIECIPRFTEFICSLKAGNTAERAMLDAADVTTNFARAGTISKKLNATVIPFLNPAIQGASKAVRNVTSAVTENKGAKAKALAIAQLVTKAVLVGVAPFVLNAILLGDDEDYKDLRDTDKENYFLIKIGEKFLKIPRGRMAAVLAGLTNRTAKSFTDEDPDWKGYIKNASTQMNPIENMARTIFSPFLDVQNNVTWYGSAIEGKQFENRAPKDRYDESTSSIAIALGKVLNYSPKKIHYILDQYSGVVGDFILPMTSKKAEKDFLSGNFVIDPVTSNNLSDKFYDIYYEAQYAKSADADNKTAEYQVKHLNRVKTAISKLYDDISTIQNSEMSDRDKLAEIRTIQIMINEMYKTAINDYELVTNAIEATSSVDDSYRYTEVTRLVYGAERALREYDDSVYSKSTVLRKAGISYDNFYKYYFSLRGIESDKDKYGNTIPGSKKKKIVANINKLNLSSEKKQLLIAVSGYTVEDEDALIRYINGLKLSAKTKLELAEICGFEVKNGKIVK